MSPSGWSEGEASLEGSSLRASFLTVRKVVVRLKDLKSHTSKAPTLSSSLKANVTIS